MSADNNDQKPTPPLQYTLIIPKDGSHTYEWKGEGSKPVEISELYVEGIDNFVYSPDGSVLALINREGVTLYNTEKKEKLGTIQSRNINYLTFSPLGNYFISWRNWRQQDKTGNLQVWDVTDFEKPIQSFSQKHFEIESWPQIRFTQDEKIIGRIIYNRSIQFFPGIDQFKTGQPTHTLKLENVSNFSFSPDCKSYHFSVFVPEKKGQPAFCKIYQYPFFDKHVSHLSTFNASDVKFSWNLRGTALLCQTISDFDKTGSSYYGKSHVYFMTIKGEANKVPLDDSEGGVYTAIWKPNGRHFLVIYGYPAKATLFSLRLQPIVDFGTAPRNTCLWQPAGHLVIIAGFGSLQGDVDIWDPYELKKTSHSNAHGSAWCEWSPDGKYILTGVLSTKLQVDNEYKIRNFYGDVLIDQKMPNKLQKIQFRPASLDVYPWKQIQFKYLDPKEEKKKQQQSTTKTKYRHPNWKRGGSVSLSHRPKSNNDGPKKYVAPNSKNRGTRSNIPGNTRRIPGDTRSNIPGNTRRIPGDTRRIPGDTRNNNSRGGRGGRGGRGRGRGRGRRY